LAVVAASNRRRSLTPALLWGAHPDEFLVGTRRHPGHARSTGLVRGCWNPAYSRFSLFVSRP